MNCRDVQDWLLESEDPQADRCGSEDVAEHLRECLSCRRLASDLADLEQAWRSLPVPETSKRAKRAFLDRLAGPPVPAAAPPRPSRRRVLQWLAGSAAGLLAAGTGGWVFLSERRVEAEQEVLDQLVDWNLSLSQAQSDADRGRVYAAQADRFRSVLRQAHLPVEQGQAAAVLLDNAAWLAGNRDPTAEAERFDNLSERLLNMAADAAVRGDQRRMARLLKQYNRVQEAGVDLNVQRAEAAGVLDFDRQGKLERLALGDPDRVRQLADLLEKAPDASRKEIQRALGLHRTRMKKPRRKPSRRKAESGDVGRRNGPDVPYRDGRGSGSVFGS